MTDPACRFHRSAKVCATDLPSLPGKVGKVQTIQPEDSITTELSQQDTLTTGAIKTSVSNYLAKRAETPYTGARPEASPLSATFVFSTPKRTPRSLHLGSLLPLTVHQAYNPLLAAAVVLFVELTALLFLTLHRSCPRHIETARKCAVACEGDATDTKCRNVLDLSGIGIPYFTIRDPLDENFFLLARIQALAIIAPVQPPLIATKA